MKYIVETGRFFKEFETYEQAELFCGENGIHCENIFEEENEE